MLIFRKPKKQKPDLELINEYQTTNDINSLEEIFGRYSHIVFMTCKKLLKNEEDSKDAVLEIFEKLITELKRHHITNFPGWLHMVTKNHCLAKMRKDNLIKIVNVEAEKMNRLFMEISHFDHLNNVQQERYENIYKALRQLKSAQRTCLELFYFSSKTYKDISMETGFTINQVKSHIQNGRRNLKNILGALNDE